MVPKAAIIVGEENFFCIGFSDNFRTGISPETVSPNQRKYPKYYFIGRSSSKSSKIYFTYDYLQDRHAFRG